MNQQDIDDLFAQAVSGDYDDDLSWKAVSALRRAGTREIFDRATDWCNSANPLLRARGADVLSQLGKTAEHPSNNFPEECYLTVSTWKPPHQAGKPAYEDAEKSRLQQETPPVDLNSRKQILGRQCPRIDRAHVAISAAE